MDTSPGGKWLVREDGWVGLAGGDVEEAGTCITIAPYPMRS